jgi:cation:H+ antiporter
MTTAIAQFALSAVIIIVAGSILTRCADEIADITQFGRLLIGSILLAGATSLPELAVDVSAASMNVPDVGMGDLIGSCLMNLIILAVADLLQKTRGALLSRLAAAHALSGVLSIALVAAVGLFVLFESKLGPAGVLGMSWGSIVVVFGYLIGVRMVYYDQQSSMRQAAAAAEPATRRGSPRVSLTRAMCVFAAAAVCIVVIAPLLARSADRIANFSGLGGTFVGTTLVAFSTSLPELVSTLAALRMGAADLAIGNIFGSNAFNMLIVVAMDMAYQGPLLAAVSPAHAITCFGAILTSSVVILGQLYRVERRIIFLEPDAALILALSFGTLWLVYLVR